jgi:hypothetical protein
MAQRQVNHDSISYNGNTTTISNLRAAIQAGEVIEAADINSLRSMINSWDNHTHLYTDQYSKATFGNTGNRNTLSESKRTDAHDQAQANVAAVSAGDLITAAHHNNLRDVVNKLRSHKHNINDRTS